MLGDIARLSSLSRALGALLSSLATNRISSLTSRLGKESSAPATMPRKSSFSRALSADLAAVIDGSRMLFQLLYFGAELLLRYPFFAPHEPRQRVHAGELSTSVALLCRGKLDLNQFHARSSVRQTVASLSTRVSIYDCVKQCGPIFQAREAVQQGAPTQASGVSRAAVWR